MGLMSDPTSGAQLILTPHPVSLEGQQHLGAQLEPGEKLGPYLRRTVPDWKGDAWEVRVNGVLVPVEVLDRVRPKDGALIEVRGIAKKQVLYIVAFALLTWWTMGAFAAAGAAGGTVFGLSSMAAYAAAAAVYVGGSVLINKVLGPKPPSMGSAQASDPVYSINSARNAPRPYEPLPFLLGSVRITPDVASMPYVTYEGNDQFLGMVLTPGINVHSIEALYNGDTPLASFEGVQTWLNGFGGHPDQPIPLFTNADSLAGGELQAGGPWIERTGSPDTVKLQLDFEGLLYDVDSKGRFNGNHVTIQIQWRETGTTAWTGSQALTIHNRDSNTVRRTVSINVNRGQYDVRVQMGIPYWHDGTPYDECRFNWTVLKSIQADETDYTGIPRIGIRIKATGQLNGALDEVRMVAHSAPVPVWTGTGWVTQHTSNPGAHLLAYARGFRDANGRLLAGIGLPDAQIDIPALQAFMVHCAENDYTYDAYIKDGRNHQEMVDAIALAGFGQTTWAGGKFSVVWASADQPLSGVVNMATIKNGTFQVDYTLANAADGVEYTYVDRATWTAVTLRVPAPGVTTMQSPARITGEGVTSEAHAARAARYHLAQSLYQAKDISYGTDLEHLTYRRMSVLALSHDMTQWGYGGRLRGAVLAGSTLTVTLDEPVPFLATPYIGLRVPGEGAYRVFPVHAFTGESDTLTLAEPWPEDVPAPGEGEGNPAHDTIWIYDIKATPGYRVRVVQIEPESDLQGAGVVVVPEGPEFWDYVHTGVYIPPANQSLLQGRPIASGLVVTEYQVVQGDTVFTELGVAFDIVGKMSHATVTLSQWLIDGWSEPEQVAETRTTFARFRIPEAGVYTITVRPYGENGVVGIPATVQYATEGADIPPPAFDLFNVLAVPGGLRKYSWAYLPDTLQAPDFAGAEIRYTAGTVADPDWDTMTPVGDDGFHPAAFEASVPVAGTWTFAARARNTSGELSDAIVITRTLPANLGEVIDEVGQDLDDITQSQVDAQMALDQEIADRLAGDLATAAAAGADATAKANAALASAMAAVSALEAQLADITGAPEWDIGVTYEIDDMVKYGGALYRALVQTTGDQPDISPAEWSKVGDYASLGEAVAAALALATQNASDLAAEVTRINALYARMPAAAGALATEASVTAVDQARIDGDQALASSVDAVSTVANGAASTAGTALTAANNAASVAATASTTASGAQSDATAALSASATNASAITAVGLRTAASPNLIPNPTGARGLTGYDFFGSGAVMHVRDELYGSQGRMFAAGPLPFPSGLISEGIATEAPTYISTPSAEGRAFTLSADMIGWPGSGLDVWVEVGFTDAAGVELGPRAQVFADAFGQWRRYSVTATAPAGTQRTFICARVAGTPSNAGIYVGWARMKLEPNAVETVYTEDATVVTLAEVSEGIDGRLRAVHTVVTDVNGHVAGTVTENDGVRSSFSILATVFRVISTLTGMGMEWQDGYLRIWKNAAQLIIGHTFGAGDLVFWYGPNVGAANCTKANGTIWFDTGGSAYFGGTLSAGVLKNAARSTAISGSAFVEVGPFSTNGGQKVVNWGMSYVNGGFQPTNPGSGSTSGTLVLERSLNGGSSWSEVSSLPITGNRTSSPEGGQYRVDIIAGASGTFTDNNTSTSNFMYRVRITSASGFPANISGSLGEQSTYVISVEQ